MNPFNTLSVLDNLIINPTIEPNALLSVFILFIYAMADHFLCLFR